MSKTKVSFLCTGNSARSQMAEAFLRHYASEKNCPRIFPGISQRLHWNFDDPATVVGSEQERMEKFRAVRDQIENQVRVWVLEQGITPFESKGSAA